MRKYILILTIWSAACMIYLDLSPAEAKDIHNCWETQRVVTHRWGPSATSFYWFPRCLTGGYWKNVQCNLYGCYCAYVDTGRVIPNTIRNVLRQYMEEHCPILSKDMPDPCSKPPAEYPCKETSKRYYYDQTSGQCEPSTTGCLGFGNLTACKDACVVETRDRCNFRENKGRKCDKKEPQERWYHDEEKGICRPFIYEGCAGNSNNYREKWICLKTCEQLQAEELGIKVGYNRYIIKLPTWLVIRHYFVPAAENVITLEQFKQIQGYLLELTEVVDEKDGEDPTKPPPPRPDYATENQTKEEICSLPPKVGPCRSFRPKWFFNEKLHKCVRFIYGGCYPNANNFKTPGHCADFCEARVRPSKLDELQGKIAYPEEYTTTTPAPTKTSGARNLGIDSEIIGEADIDVVIG